MSRKCRGSINDETKLAFGINVSSESPPIPSSSSSSESPQFVEERGGGGPGGSTLELRGSLLLPLPVSAASSSVCLVPALSVPVHVGKGSGEEGKRNGEQREEW